MDPNADAYYNRKDSSETDKNLATFSTAGTTNLASSGHATSAIKIVGMNDRNKRP